MKHGVNIPPFTDAATVVGWTRDAETAGWDGVFLWDHMQWSPRVAPLDPWVLLGAMAQVSERVRLGRIGEARRVLVVGQREQLLVGNPQPVRDL